MEDRIKIRKVPLLSLMNILSEIYDKGVDYVDIYGALRDGQDTINVVFCREYMNEEFIESFDDIGEDMREEQLPSNVNVKLSDEDLNQLL